MKRRIKNVQVEPNYSIVCLNKLKPTESYRHLRTLANEGRKGEKREEEEKKREKEREGRKGEKCLFVELETEITSLFPNFTKQLFDYSPKMNEKQLNLCLLLKAEFSNNDIASLLCLHHSSVSHLKSRIYASMCNVPNEASNWSDFLKTL